MDDLHGVTANRPLGACTSTIQTSPPHPLFITGHDRTSHTNGTMGSYADKHIQGVLLFAVHSEGHRAEPEEEH